jgi:hypothetical protein
MASVVLVHGINHQTETPDLIEANWLPALAGGVRLAGWDDLADRLWPPRSRSDSIDCRAAYYGQLFRSADVQGAGADLRDLTPEQTTLVESLSLEWLQRIAERSASGNSDRAQARLALDIVREPERVQAMGGGNLQREVLKTLARCSWVADMGMFLAERYVKTALAQLTRYLTEPAIREQTQRAVLDLVGAETRVIIGHSLGSVVVYECAHQLNYPLPLLVTLGSPLGLRTIVTERLTPAPSFPRSVAVWLNAANLEDPVAAEPDLRALFARDVPATSRFEGIRFQEVCDDPHRAETYLSRVAVGRAVSEALASSLTEPRSSASE